MSYFKLFSIILLLLLIDLVSKYLFFDMQYLQDIFHASFNTGISFSLPVNQLFVETITIIFIFAILYLFSQKKIHPIIVVLIISWALGNLLDRLFLWWVRDFIWLGFGAIFNIADLYITLGVIYYILFELRDNQKKI